MLVAAHQPNYLPGLSVVRKAREVDAIIWLDDVQFTRGGFTNRNRMPDGSWLTVPVRHETLGGPIRSVAVSYERPWVEKHIRTLRLHYGDAAAPFIEILERRLPRLVSLNLACLREIVGDGTGAGPQWFLQSGLGIAGEEPVSVRLAAMVARVGGSAYLSGPSGRRYLDEGPFWRRGIRVRYYEHEGPNPCALGELAAA